MKKLIAKIPYSKVDYVFITNHYDLHLQGICRYQCKICEFENKYPEDKKKIMTSIYSLNFWEHLNWKFRKWKFEACVGFIQKNILF